MIRYVDLSAFYWCDEPEPVEPRWPFAFLDTVSDKFIELDGTQIWDTVEGFTEDHAAEFPSPDDCRRLERFLRLIPDNVPKKRAEIKLP